MNSPLVAKIEDSQDESQMSEGLTRYLSFHCADKTELSICPNSVME